MGRRKSIDNPFAWSAAQEKAAVLLAEGSMSQISVAAEVGVTRQTVGKWMQQPEYQAHVAAVRAEMIERVKITGIANKESRLLAYADRHQRLRELYLSRARSNAKSEVPGMATGLLSSDITETSYDDRTVVYESHTLDRHLLREMRELEKLIATEMGDLVQRTDITSGDAPIKAYIAIDVDAV